MSEPVVVVMGVSGGGKTTIGTLLADRTGWPFIDADALHPTENVAKMTAGTPLTDEDRWPWLERVAAWISRRHSAGEPGIVACSALKRGYRDLLRKADPALKIVYLEGDRDVLRERLSSRSGHFFVARLLESQLADLEPPSADEDPIIVPIEGSPEEIVDSVLAALGR